MIDDPMLAPLTTEPVPDLWAVINDRIEHDPPAGDVEQTDRSRHRRPLLAAALVLAVALVGVGIAAGTRNDDSATTAGEACALGTSHPGLPVFEVVAPEQLRTLEAAAIQELDPAFSMRAVDGDRTIEVMVGTFEADAFHRLTIDVDTPPDSGIYVAGTTIAPPEAPAECRTIAVTVAGPDGAVDAQVAQTVAEAVGR